MYDKALSTYYALSMFVVGTAFFVMQPTQDPQMISWQQDIGSQLKIAWVQTIGDRPWFEEVSVVYEAVANFYEQSSVAAIALIEEPEADADIAFVFSNVYNSFVDAAKPAAPNANATYAQLELPPIPTNFMAEEPLYNLIPYKTIVKTIVDPGSVAGISVDTEQPVNNDAKPWVTIKDNSTSQLYCLAIYNDTVNKYLGPCKNDYY